mmetsp:Transcript_46626/g.92390  ORF Transcript_46626/g.92390 Transcript_46626/m.92390 type:complete len:900 (-) Transcript_46626:82-2781(-)
MSALIHTINSDDEIEMEIDSSDEEMITKPDTKKSNKKKTKKQPKPAFSFDFDDGQFPRHDKNNQSGSNSEEELSDSSSANSESDEENDDNVRVMARAEERIARAATKSALKKKLKTKSDKEGNVPIQESDDDKDEQEDRDQAEYFEKIIDARANGSSGVEGAGAGGQILFSQLSLSRPLLRAVERTGYVSATPIQAQTIPYALAGKDICASAETGSGKTAAFVLPFLERLLYRPRDVASIRVLVITPTRELAQQIHVVLERLAQYTDVTSCLICGGKKDVRSQEATLRQRPDVVICTPGRMLDHLRNSPSVSLDELDVLVLDEADRLLDLGFQEEVEELVKYCPISRQTMLFSATMTSKVEDLIRMSLKRPVRVRISGGTAGEAGDGSGAISFAPRLVQEFIKVRSSTGAAVTGSADIPGSSGVDQEVVESMLLALVCRSFGKQCIVFFEMKRNAHRFCALLNLMNVKAAELHGDVSQAQRYLALERFRTQQVDVLVATDVAARGLDIPGVQTVINAEMPRNLSIYVHRVGRTARAGCGGRSITLVSDARRKMMKEVLKMKGEYTSTSAEGDTEEGKQSLAVSSGQMLSRTIPGAVLAQFTEKVRSLESEMREYFRAEKMKANLDELQMEAEKAENLLLHEQEIQARPARTWYQTERQKGELRETSRTQVKEEQSAAQLGKTEAIVQRSAAERARAMALADDYPLDKAKDKSHKMSRKKRRRLEALAADDGESEDEAKHKASAAAIEAAPKKAKMSVRAKEESKKERVLSEMGMKRVPVQKARPASADGDEGDGIFDADAAAAIANKRKKGGKNSGQATKVVRQSFAVGGLDQDYVDWGMGTAGSASSQGGSKGGMNKTQIRQAAREKPFTDFDASKKLRKGGKAGNKSFKSKSKFKRR